MPVFSATLEEAVMVGVAPQFPQEGALFLNRATVGLRDRPIMPRAPQMVQHGPAWSRKVPQSPACSSNGPANSRNVPRAGRAGPCWTKYFDDHGIRARRRLAPQWRSSLTIAHRSLDEYITADPQREFEVQR
jgi:hypothetical protein